MTEKDYNDLIKNEAVLKYSGYMAGQFFDYDNGRLIFGFTYSYPPVHDHLIPPARGFILNRYSNLIENVYKRPITERILILVNAEVFDYATLWEVVINPDTLKINASIINCPVIHSHILKRELAGIEIDHSDVTIL